VASLRAAFEKSDNALKILKEFVLLPLEAERGSAKKVYSGAIEFRDVAFFYPGSSTPLYESLSITLEPGSLVFVVGESGTGKTTMAKMLVGLMTPVRGQILVDGLDLRQVVLEWWRRQIVYFPQEPSFLNATIEENLRTLNPDMTNERLNEIINIAGLRTFVDESQEGLATLIRDNGRQLAVGIRRQLALARALTTDGRLVVFDEMFDGLDAEGKTAVNHVLNQFVKEGRTVFIMSHRASKDEAINAIIDLNSKPKPRITKFSEAYPSGIAHRAPTAEEIALRDGVGA
jgi:ATP-binding cassette subfamily C protein LapB